MFASTRHQLREIQRFRSAWISRHEVAEMPKGETRKLRILIGSGRDGRLWRRWTSSSIENWAYPGNDFEFQAGERKTTSIFWLIHLVEERLYNEVYDAKERPIWSPISE